MKNWWSLFFCCRSCSFHSLMILGLKINCYLCSVQWYIFLIPIPGYLDTWILKFLMIFSVFLLILSFYPSILCTFIHLFMFSLLNCKIFVRFLCIFATNDEINRILVFIRYKSLSIASLLFFSLSNCTKFPGWFL